MFSGIKSFLRIQRIYFLLFIFKIEFYLKYNPWMEMKLAIVSLGNLNLSDRLILVMAQWWIATYLCCKSRNLTLNGAVLNSRMKFFPKFFKKSDFWEKIIFGEIASFKKFLECLRFLKNSHFLISPKKWLIR